jgi:hypothetical protein
VATCTGCTPAIDAEEAQRGALAGAALVRRKIAEIADASAIGVKLDRLIFEAAPQPLDKDVVHASAFAVHADHDAMPLQGAGKVVAGELAALIGIEDLRPAIARERVLEGVDKRSFGLESRG